MKLTNELNLPQPFVDAATSDYQYTDKRYSVTSVLKGTREAILQRRHSEEIETDVSEMVWAIFGSAVHKILEQSEETADQLKENWLSVEVQNGYELSGIFDLYDDATGTVTDYKTATVWKFIYKEFDDWRTQCLAYVWLLRKIGFNARRGEIVGMLKDHSKTKAKTDRSYPQHPVQRIGWNFTDKDLEGFESWLKAKFAEIEQSEKLSDDDLPLCSDVERWHKPDKYAVMKEGRKTAVKLYDSEEEANARVEAEGKGFYVEHRKGEDSKCLNYCSACEFCSHYKELMNNAE
nr:MAG TPA: Exonuclease [Caudoviricetes sp.]